MNIAHYISNWWKEALEYKERVLKDGGTTKREDIVQQYNQMCKQNGIFDSIKFAWLGEAGGKLRQSGANQFWTKAYSLVTPQAKYGSELVVNGGFNNGGAGWSTIGESTVNTGIGRILSTSGVYSEIAVSSILTTGKTYKIEFDVVSTNGVNIQDLDSFSYPTSTPGRKSVLKTNTTSVNLGFKRIGITDVSIDNISVVEVLNSLDGSPTDATQTTSTSQPHIAGNIAPTERLGMKNPNGGSNYMTHPTISFAANEAWSVTTVVNWNGTNLPSNNTLLMGNGNVANSFIGFNTSGGGALRFINSSSNNGNGTTKISNRFIAKTNILTIVASGTFYSIYINGNFIETVSVQTNFTFSSLIQAVSAIYTLYGSIHAHIIRAQALTPTQVAAEANFLRSLYPEIPSVTIGSQVWATSNCEMVATPMGNLITNVTANATWADSTNIYNTTYAATSGTDEQKTYAAVKAAAMWRYYNNDAALGSIYNKLYNDYAMKLLAMDIAYYNTANPSTPWGWDIPLESDWSTLQTTVNNNAEALKKDGTVYWSSPNAGTNSSLFTAIPAGYVKEDGTFSGLNTAAIFASKDNMDIPKVGKSIRLIKK